MKKQFVNDLTVGPITPALLRFAIPVMLANLLQTLYNMVDMVIIGRFVGSAGLSAVSAGGDIMHFFTFIGMGFATAGQIMVSQYVGAGRKKELNAVIGTLFTFVLGSGVILGLLGILCAGGFIRMINVPSEAVEGALAYVTCCCAGMLFIFGYNMVSAVLRGMGDSRHPMLFIGLAAILNTLLDLLFIAVFRWGAFGAALATVIGQGLSFLLCFFYLYRNREQFGFDFRLRSFRISRRPLEIMVKLGIPIVIQSSAGSISLLFVGHFINPYGVVASAVTGVGNKLNGIALIVANAMNTAGATNIGQNFGAGKIDRVRHIVYRVFLIDFAFEALISILILLFPRQVFGIFDQSPAVLDMARDYAPVAAIAFMGFAFRSPSLAFINGLGNARMNFLMGVTEGFILRMGLTWLLGVALQLGLPGFWYGYTIGSYGYAVVVFPYFFSGIWTRRRSFAAED